MAPESSYTTQQAQLLLGIKHHWHTGTPKAESSEKSLQGKIILLRIGLLVLKTKRSINFGSP